MNVDAKTVLMVMDIIRKSCMQNENELVNWKNNNKIKLFFRCVPLACNEYFNCGENANCEMNGFGKYECKCAPGKEIFKIFFIN